MAKGFITLENGENFSVRWTGYDEILRIAIKELFFLDNGYKLSEWLKTRVPDENGDESGVAFWNESNEMIFRDIDLRGLTKPNRQLFWEAIENGAAKLSEFGEQYSMLNPIVMHDLMKMHQASKDNVEIIDEDAKYIITKNDFIEKVGPDWLYIKSDE